VYEKVFIDFKATPKSSRGHTQVLIYVDCFTRFLRLYPCKSCDSRSAIKALQKAFLEGGIPGTVICDEASAFTCPNFREFISTSGSKLHVVPANSHQSNGLAEAYCKTVGERIALMCSKQLQNWDLSIPEIQLAINTSVSKSLGNTPFFLYHGYHPSCSSLQASLTPETKAIGVGDHLETLFNARLNSQNVLQKSQKAQQDRYNHGRLRPSYQKGQRVWIFFSQRSTPQLPKKYAPSWRPGRILENINLVTYLVRVRQAGKLIAKKVHVNFLKPRKSSS
jgi:hypothetical protein